MFNGKYIFLEKFTFHHFCIKVFYSDEINVVNKLSLTSITRKGLQELLTSTDSEH